MKVWHLLALVAVLSTSLGFVVASGMGGPEPENFLACRVVERSTGALVAFASAASPRTEPSADAVDRVLGQLGMEVGEGPEGFEVVAYNSRDVDGVTRSAGRVHRWRVRRSR